ncbi:MAG: hypothetical protein N2067_08575 [Spirochaetaceae bacterium]|nr:hypothetical protein [Spirochaetaceae bacterium]
MMTIWFNRALRRQAEQIVTEAKHLGHAGKVDSGAAHETDSDGWIRIAHDRPGTVITREAIDMLPEPVRRYFHAAQVEGKARPSSFSIIMEGRIRNDADARWMPMVMRQFNRVDVPARIVYIESPGTPMAGIDSFIEGKGRMLIRLFGFLTLTDAQGAAMSQSAMVTFLNDLVLCPAACFSVPLEWKAIDGERVALRLCWAGMTVTAELHIDERGRLRNWLSNDRYAEVKGRQLPDRWSTPFSENQQELAGFMIPAAGQGVHDYDGKPFVYVELDHIHDLVLEPEGLPQ